MHSGIPLPFNIYAGYVVTVCGTAILAGTVPDSWLFGTSLAHFQCKDYSIVDDEVPVNFLQSAENENSDTGSPVVCFGLEWEATDFLPRCDTHFVLGFHVLDLNDPETNIRFTYTFNVVRNCE